MAESIPASRPTCSSEQGHDVIGVFMRHGEASPAACGEQERGARSEPNRRLRSSLLAPRSHHKQGCCTAADAEDARRVADKLGIPFYALNLQAEFGQIIDYFVAEYTAGRTPNPCVQCNNWIKFGKLFDYADSVGAEFVATGHYARLERRRRTATSRCCAASTRPRTSRTCCSAFGASCCRG